MAGARGLADDVGGGRGHPRRREELLPPRPTPEPLVAVVGFSFPSGHAVAGAATAVALVLVLLPAGPARRRWELAAIAFAFVMALSRVYLEAHWFSDVVAGVLLGAGVALGSVGLMTEIRDVALRRKARAGSARTG